jgi:hypothetical protein
MSATTPGRSGSKITPATVPLWATCTPQPPQRLHRSSKSPSAGFGKNRWLMSALAVATRPSLPTSLSRTAARISALSSWNVSTSSTE